MSNTEIGAIKNLLQETGKSLKGHARRLFMARTVKDVFEGVTYRAAQEMGWKRGTISKGLHELSSGVESVDGRKGTPVVPMNFPLDRGPGGLLSNRMARWREPPSTLFFKGGTGICTRQS